MNPTIGREEPDKAGRMREGEKRRGIKVEIPAGVSAQKEGGRRRAGEFKCLESAGSPLTCADSLACFFFFFKAFVPTWVQRWRALKSVSSVRK